MMIFCPVFVCKLSKLKKFQVNCTNSFLVIVSAISKKMVSRKTSSKIYNHVHTNDITHGQSTIPGPYIASSSFS